MGSHTKHGYDEVGNTGGGGGGGGAPTDASYVTIGANGSLSAERVLTAGSGITLTDGGANSTVTVALTINGLTADTPVAADSIAFYDASGADNNKVTLTNFATAMEAILNHDNLVGFVANEHIDWTNTSSNLVTTGTGTFDSVTVTGGTVDWQIEGSLALLQAECQTAGSSTTFYLKAKDDDGTDDVKFWAGRATLSATLGLGWDTSDDRYVIEVSDPDSKHLEIKNNGGGKVWINNIPTASGGLPAGTLWNNAGTLAIA